jgi:uncharacterized protein YndB with AHSA1/START domain
MRLLERSRSHAPSIGFMAQRIVSATRTIAAPAEKIFDVLANPSLHPVIDGSGSVKAPKTNPERLSLGATFSMDMKVGFSYVTKNRVSEFEENHVIAWHHFAQFVWRYQLDAVDGGTKVTETFDYSKPWGILIEINGTPKKNQASMERTLARLDSYVTTGSVDA